MNSKPASTTSVSAEYFLSLPGSIAEARKIIETQEQRIEDLLDVPDKVDREKMDTLTLTGDIELDAAICFATTISSDDDKWRRMDRIFRIFRELKKTQQRMAGWEGGIMLVDFETPPVERFKPCPQWLALRVMPNPKLHIVHKPPSDRNTLPISIYVCGQPVLSLAWNERHPADGHLDSIKWYVQKETDHTEQQVELIRLFDPKGRLAYAHPIGGIYLGSAEIRRAMLRCVRHLVGGKLSKKIVEKAAQHSRVEVNIRSTQEFFNELLEIEDALFSEATS